MEDNFKMRKSKEFIALRSRVGANVREERVFQGISQEELACRADMGWRHLQKIEAGEVNVTLLTLARLGKALKVDPTTFLAT